MSTHWRERMRRRYRVSRRDRAALVFWLSAACVALAVAVALAALM